MSYRLGEYVIYGELFNERNNTTFGRVLLRGTTPGNGVMLRFELTGNADADLHGRAIRFQPETEKPGPVFRMEEHPSLQLRQIGPTGAMTAAGWVRTFDCSEEEFVRRAELGEPVPTQWKRRLYLEWFGQNGPVVVEMGGVQVEERVGMPGEGDLPEMWAPLLNPAPHPEPDAHPVVEESVRQWAPVWAELEGEADFAPPVDLQGLISASEVDTSPWLDAEEEEEEDDDEMEYFKRVNFCIENGISIPLAAVMEDFATLPPPEALTDEDAAAWLKVLLGQLAVRGIALDMCEHFTARDAYQYLVREVLPEAGFIPEAGETGWVQHFSTRERCAACEAKVLEDYKDLGDPPF